MSMGVGGGVERILTAKINYLVNLGYEVKIVITDYHKPHKLVPAYGLDSSVEIIHYPINFTEDYSFPLWKRAYRTLLKWRKYYKLLKTFLYEYRPDIVCSTQPLDTAFLPFIKDGSKKILEYHNSKDEYRLYRPLPQKHPKQVLFRLYYFRDKVIASLFDATVVLTNRDKEARKYKNATVIPNFSDLIYDKECNKMDNIILALGRFTEQKDFEALISIWAQIAPKHLFWKLRIVGEGYLYERLCNQVKELGLQGRVEIRQHSHDVLSLYQEASIYAMTSRFEGFGLVLLEAQIMRLPIISYDCPCGPSDIITDGVDGFLIPPGDQQLFAKKLDTLIDDPNLRESMGKQATESAQRFAPETVMAMWIKLFQILKEGNNNGL